MSNNISTTTIVEKILTALIRDCELSPQDFFLAVHNTFAHGKPWGDLNVNWGKNDEYLREIFEGISISADAAEKASV